jgi:hypothetical protein
MIVVIPQNDVVARLPLPLLVGLRLPLRFRNHFFDGRDVRFGDG